MRLVFCALLSLPGALLQAQTPTILRGVVTDSAGGQGIAGATIEIPGTRFTTRSGDDGSWTIGRVPAGTHTVRVARLGYSPRAIAGVRVADGETTTLDVALTRPPFHCPRSSSARASTACSRPG